MSILRPWPISVLLLFCSVASARGEIRPDFEMDHDPEFRVPAPVKVFSERLKPLWLQALARPEADLQRMAADAISRGHAVGIPGMEEAVPGLAAVVVSPSSHPTARLAAAQALVKLDAKQAAAQMASSAEKYGLELRQVVEPALAAWDYNPLRAVWQARVNGAGVRHRDLVLAIRCLATVGERPAAANLLGIAHDRLRVPSLRMEAALSAGVLQDHGLESDARRLTASDAATRIDRLCAVQLLAHHTGDDAQRLLAQFAIDPEPAIAVIALRRLIDIDPHLVLPLAEGALQNADAKVRQCGVDAYVQVPDPQRVTVLGGVLDDPHPGVRRSVRESLHELARRDELDGPIRQAATEMLAGDRWRGLEQAALLLAALDHKPASARLVELLEFGRLDVGIAAAWGLKKLALPDTLPAMFDKARRNTEIRKSGSPPSGLDEQTAHLFESIGRMKYTPAEPLLREYIPKDYKMGELSRSSAIWSLGLLHAAVPDEQLAAQFAERANDVVSIPPEIEAVWIASIVSIGRMKAVSQIEMLQKRGGGNFAPTRLGMSLRWAMIELTGEEIPEPNPPKTGIMNWFLEPLEE